ncbi:MAG TPA: HEAT repeat domain-containing protein [Pyrinomonadaceae bacterium]|nr:HEAT repeat domain-containing protein [Pyrinomonadaceae bacterium]
MPSLSKTFRIAALLLTVLASGAAATAGAQSSPTAFRPAKLDSDVREQIVALGSSDPVARAFAACTLGKMRTRAVAAIPKLVALLGDGAAIKPAESCGHQAPFEDEQWQPRYPDVHDPSPGEAATLALLAIGDPAVAALKDALLLNENWRARKNAAWALAHHGEAVEQLITALYDPAWQVRAQAAYALFQRGGNKHLVIWALVARLKDDAWQVREQAAMALAQKGSSGEDFFPPLFEALKEDNVKVRDAVAFALGTSAGDREVDLLIAARKDPDKRVRGGVRRALDVIKGRMNGTTASLRKRKIPG